MKLLLLIRGYGIGKGEWAWSVLLWDREYTSATHSVRLMVINILAIDTFPYSHDNTRWYKIYLCLLFILRLIWASFWHLFVSFFFYADVMTHITTYNILPIHTMFTVIYKKYIFTALCTHCDNLLPPSYQVDLILTLLLRCFSICTNFFTKKWNFIDKCIHRFLNCKY